MAMAMKVIAGLASTGVCQHHFDAEVGLKRRFGGKGSPFRSSEGYEPALSRIFLKLCDIFVFN
jgi:hypothetical protein